MGHGIGLPGMTTMACRGFTQNQPVRAWTLGEGSSVVTHSAPVRCSHRERPHPAILQSCTTCPQSTPGTSFWSPLEAALEVRGGGRWPPEGWRYVFSSAFPLLPNSRDSTEQEVRSSGFREETAPPPCPLCTLAPGQSRRQAGPPGSWGPGASCAWRQPFRTRRALRVGRNQSPLLPLRASRSPSPARTPGPSSAPQSWWE